MFNSRYLLVIHRISHLIMIINLHIWVRNLEIVAQYTTGTGALPCSDGKSHTDQVNGYYISLWRFGFQQFKL